MNTSLRSLVTAFVVCLLVMAGVRTWIMPSFSDVQYTFGTTEFSGATLPLRVKDGGPNIIVRTTIQLANIYPKLYHIIPDDCLVSIVIDGKKVDDKAVKFCDYTKGKVVNLGPYLSPGTHQVEFLVSNGPKGPGALSVAPSGSDPVVMALSVAFLLLMLGFLCLGMHFLYLRQQSVAAFTIFGFGTILRLVYVFFTNYKTRAYDWDGHIEYIWYIAQHAAIPPATGGWEFHQAPLYYFLMAPIVAIGHAVGRADVYLLRELQYGSFVLSVATLAIILWIGRMFWQKKEEEGRFVIFGLLAATFPTLVFFASRITNDALFVLLSCVLIALILKFWRKPNALDWYALTIVFCLTFLTKATVLSFVPVLARVLICCKGWSLLEKCKKGLVASLLVVLLVGWFPMYRIVTEKDMSRITSFNHTSLNGSLRIVNTPGHLFAFNPLQVLRFPFNDNWKDQNRRQYFWEYLYRSTFFGEFTLDQTLQPLAIVLLLMGMVGVILAAIGVVSELWRNRHKALPNVALIFWLVLTIFLYRLRFYVSADQDFRIIQPAIVPLLLFVVQGAYVFRGRTAYLLQDALLLLIVVNTLFLLSLGMVW
jgi:hypothetical protein